MSDPLILEPEYLRLPLGLAIFLGLWFFSVGGCVGSFLNVVIYRLPHGLSIVSPPSRCPHCNHNIRFYDNLPVLGWLLLRGKCRDCGSPIAVRYPLVEFWIGAMFAALALETFAQGGPWWLLNIAPREFLFFGWGALLAVFCYYQLLLCTLWAAALIAWDNQTVPVKLFWPALLAGLLVPAWWNEVRPFAISNAEWVFTARQGLLDGALGALCGLGLGLLSDLVRNVKDAGGESRGDVTLAATSIGLAWGWQSALSALVLGSVLAVVWLVATGRSWRSASSAQLAGTALAATALALAGKLWFAQWPAFVSGRIAPVIFGGAGVVFACGALVRLLTPPPPAEPSIETTCDVMYP